MEDWNCMPANKGVNRLLQEVARGRERMFEFLRSLAYTGRSPPLS